MRFKWGDHPLLGFPGYFAPENADSGIVYGDTDRLFVRPRAGNDTIIVWTPPSAGVVDLTARASIDGGTNGSGGVKLKVFSANRDGTVVIPATTGQIDGTPRDSLLTKGPPLDLIADGLAVAPLTPVYFRFNKVIATGLKVNCDVKLTISFTPKP